MKHAANHMALPAGEDFPIPLYWAKKLQDRKGSGFRGRSARPENTGKHQRLRSTSWQVTVLVHFEAFFRDVFAASDRDFMLRYGV
jgi:hypothetical protein